MCCGLAVCQSRWVSWWTKWHWDRFFSSFSSVHQCFVPVFICMLLLPEGQADEAGELSKKQCSFVNLGARARRVLSLNLRGFNSITELCLHLEQLFLYCPAGFAWLETVPFRNRTWGHLIGYAASVFHFMSLITLCALGTVIKLERTVHRLPKGLCMGHSLKLSSTDPTHTHWEFQP
jgi:hypothetical protein